MPNVEVTRHCTVCSIHLYGLKNAASFIISEVMHAAAVLLSAILRRSLSILLEKIIMH